jgi:peptide chain release factor
MINSLEVWMVQLKIFEDDIIEKFILGTGSGGQKINKTSSCVYLHHIPTGIQVKCQESRSREVNRQLARQALCRRIEEMRRQKAQEKKELAAKVRRQSRRPSARAKEKNVECKRKVSAKKQLRKTPKVD